jgi:hypothetical protein
VPSPYTIAAAGVEQIILTEFAPEGVVPLHDEIHESLGESGRVVGISMDERGDAPMARNRVAQETWVKIKWWEEWTKEVDPTQIKDPRLIAELAHRLQQALAAAELTSSGDFWFFNWEGTEYPRDPVGNKTRFIMRVRAFGNNAGLLETGP